MKVKSFDECSLADQRLRWKNVTRVLKGLSKHEREKHWDMRNWGITTECGTIACAAGHCGLDPWFIKHGFQVIPSTMDHERYTQINCGSYGSFKNSNPRHFFGDAGADSIFYNDKPRSVEKVIEEVEDYIQSELT